MKFNELRSIGHNIADSLASGIGLLIGVYDMSAFAEARRSRDGFITVDFLAGRCIGNKPSRSLARAIVLYRDALTDLCGKHGTTPSAFRELTARYSVDTSHKRFVVTIKDQHGRRAVDEYVGVPGKRVRVLASGIAFVPRPARALRHRRTSHDTQGPQRQVFGACSRAR